MAIVYTRAFRLAANDLLYAPYSTYHGLYYTSFRALAGTRIKYGSVYMHHTKESQHIPLSSAYSLFLFDGSEIPPPPPPPPATLQHLLLHLC